MPSSIVEPPTNRSFAAPSTNCAGKLIAEFAISSLGLRNTVAEIAQAEQDASVAEASESLRSFSIPAVGVSAVVLL